MNPYAMIFMKHSKVNTTRKKYSIFSYNNNNNNNNNKELEKEMCKWVMVEERRNKRRERLLQ